MTNAYIRPEDVSSEDAKKVLDFLNSAQTPEEIAETVEIPGELDVGIRVAQRILARREELGGAFSDLKQVADVPMVGPERFTEIVAVLTGRPTYAPPADLAVSVQRHLLRELHTLCEQVNLLKSAVGALYHVRLQLAEPNAFAGQLVVIIAKVTDALDGAPKVGVPLTVVTTCGTLRSFTGFGVREGNPITVQTDVDGTVKVIMTSPLFEQMSGRQQAVLESALGLLDGNAENPTETASGLAEMVRQYCVERNTDLRRAIDINFLAKREKLLETPNPRDYMNAWSYTDALILAYVGNGGEFRNQDTAVPGLGMLTVHLKEWVGPWYQTYIGILESESKLGEEIDDIKQRGGSANALSDRILSRARSYVGRQRGMVGELIGQKISEKSIRQFLGTGVVDLSLETRLSLFPLLTSAASDISTLGTGALRPLSQARTDIQKEMNSKLSEVNSTLTENVDTITGQIGTLETQLAGKVDVSEFNNALAGKVDAATFEGFQAQVNESLQSKVETANFNQFKVEMNAAMENKVDNTTIDQYSRKVNEDIGVLAASVGDLKMQLAEKVNVSEFNNALEGKVNTATFEGFQSQVSESLQTKVDTDNFSQFMAEVKAAMEDKVEAEKFSQFQTQVGNSLKGKLNSASFNEFSKTVNSDLGSLRSKITELERRRRP